MKNIFSKLGITCAAVTILIASSCKKDSTTTTAVPDITGPNQVVYALGSSNMLYTLNAASPAMATATLTISGLQTGETMLAIDFRPATGELYGIGSTSRMYIINKTTGATRVIGTAAFTPAISGNILDIDFNPTVDRMRLVTSSGQNLRLNPETGTVATVDGVLNGVTSANISAVAYNLNRAGATTTTLFDIDVTTDKLYKQDPPNDGKLVEVGSLGLDITATGGFDISSDGTVAIAAMTSGGVTGLYSIDITTGKAAKYAGTITTPILSIAIPTEAVAYAISSANELAIFNPLAATPTVVTKTITGLATNETILGLDFRPVNGQLFAVGSTSRIYAVNTSSGVMTAVSTVPFTPLLSGTDFGFDFNPTVDRIRLISNTGQNLRLNPNDGTVAAIDGVISPGTPSITAAAYTNNFAGATTTVLYDIDTQTSRLYKQDPPNNGTLVDVGPLGVTALSANGFDIGSTSGTAYALLNVGGTTKVYSINLTTGAATAGSTLAGNYKGFTIGLGF